MGKMRACFLHFGKFKRLSKSTPRINLRYLTISLIPEFHWGLSFPDCNFYQFFYHFLSEMRAIQCKQEETGFITADELMRLQKAGFNRPRDVPPKPQPKDRRILREPVSSKFRHRAYRKMLAKQLR